MKSMFEYLSWVLLGVLLGTLFNLVTDHFVWSTDKAPDVHAGEIWETDKKSDPFNHEPPTQYFVTGLAVGSDGNTYVEFFNMEVGPSYKHSYEVSWFTIGSHLKTPAPTK